MRRLLAATTLLASVALIPSAAQAACADCGLNFQASHALNTALHPARTARQPRAYRSARSYRTAVAALLSPPIARTPAAIPGQIIGGTLGTVKQLVDFFIGKGWSAAQSFGLVANFYAESRLIPHIVGDAGRSVGIGQWNGARLIAFQRKFGKPVQRASVIEQAEFAHWELTNTAAAAGALLKATKTPAEAAAIVSRHYERPSRDESYSRGALAERLALAVNLPANVKVEPIATKPTDPVVPSSVPVLIAGIAGVPTAMVTFLQRVQDKCGAVKVISGYRAGPGQMCHGMNQAVDYQVTNPACAFALANEPQWKGLGHTNDYHAHAAHGVPVHFHLSTCRQEAGWRGDHRSYYARLGGARHYAARPRTRVARYYAKTVRAVHYAIAR